MELETNNLMISKSLTKRECNKIKLKDRNYKVKFDPKKDKKEKVKYWCELDTYNDIQIVRFFQVDRKQECKEVQRTYIRGKEYLHKSYGCYFNWYSYRYNTGSNFDYRNYRRIAIYPNYIKTINILEDIKPYITRKVKNTDVLGFIICVMENKDNNNLESLSKVNYDLFFNLYRIAHSDYDFIQKINNYIRQFQLISKWGYKVKPEVLDIYLDHLSLVKELGLDLHSPKYIAPKNLKEAHEELIRKKDRLKNRITKEMEQEYKDRVIGQYHLNEFPVKENKGIKIIPLLSVKQVRDEALYQHNCLFTNEYYKKEYTLLFTSSINDRKLETIEFDLDEKEIVQSRSFKNGESEYHDKIIELGNKTINQFLSTL